MGQGLGVCTMKGLFTYKFEGPRLPTEKGRKTKKENDFTIFFFGCSKIKTLFSTCLCIPSLFLIGRAQKTCWMHYITWGWGIPKTNHYINKYNILAATINAKG